MTTYTREELEALFSAMLDESAPPFMFGNLEYPASKVLEAMDPVLWREEFLNWMNAEDITELTDRTAPDVELYAYAKDIEDEYENSQLSAIELAEQYEEQRGDELYDWHNDTF
jgi:hypothetical protein